MTMTDAEKETLYLQIVVVIGFFFLMIVNYIEQERTIKKFKNIDEHIEALFSVLNGTPDCNNKHINCKNPAPVDLMAEENRT